MAGSDELRSLYQELILDHAQTPVGKGIHAPGTGRSHQINTTCGDEVTVVVTLTDGALATLEWDGAGCSISQASASMMTDLLEHATESDADAFLEEFREALRSRGEIELDESRFGDAAALNGVSRYVARVKCAMLPWVALEGALAESRAAG